MNEEPNEQEEQPMRTAQVIVREKRPVVQQDSDRATVMQMLAQAVESGKDIATVEKLVELAERMDNRRAEQAFAAAFAEMQADLPEIDEKGQIKVKDEVRSTFAKLEDINEAVKPIMKKNGFGISFRIHQADGRIKVTGILRHALGHSETTEFIAGADDSGSKNNVQAINSTISYGKRITMRALLNITSRGEDDDGQAAGKTGKFITTEQAVDIDMRAMALDKLHPGYRARFLKWANIERADQIPEARYKECLNGLSTAEQQAKKNPQPKANEQDP